MRGHCCLLSLAERECGSVTISQRTYRCPLDCRVALLLGGTRPHQAVSFRRRESFRGGYRRRRRRPVALRCIHYCWGGKARRHGDFLPSASGPLGRHVMSRHRILTGSPPVPARLCSAVQRSGRPVSTRIRTPGRQSCIMMQRVQILALEASLLNNIYSTEQGGKGKSHFQSPW